MSLKFNFMTVFLVLSMIPCAALFADEYSRYEESQYYPSERGLRAKGFVQRENPQSKEMMWALRPAVAHTIVPPFLADTRVDGKSYKWESANVPGLLEIGDKKSPPGQNDLKNFLYDVYKLETNREDICEFDIYDIDSIGMRLVVLDAEGAVIASDIGGISNEFSWNPKVKFTAKGGPMYIYVLPKDIDGLCGYYLGVSVKRLVDANPQPSAGKPGDDFP